jgi:hypothetical protein
MPGSWVVSHTQSGEAGGGAPKLPKVMEEVVGEHVGLPELAGSALVSSLPSHRTLLSCVEHV